MTHDSASAQSRSDRIYANFEPSDLPDRQIFAGVEDWDFRTSRRRPAGAPPLLAQDLDRFRRRLPSAQVGHSA
eukprot:5926844-Pyramimonas_sp.AAC.1